MLFVPIFVVENFKSLHVLQSIITIRKTPRSEKKVNVKRELKDKVQTPSLCFIRCVSFQRVKVVGLFLLVIVTITVQLKQHGTKLRYYFHYC